MIGLYNLKGIILYYFDNIIGQIVYDIDTFEI